MLNMQSLLLMAQICHQAGEENIEHEKIPLKAIQNLLQSNWSNIFQINLGVHNGCN
jgi:hypothetical protein